MTENRYICLECGQHIEHSTEILKAPNPFEPSYELIGCPTCHAPNRIAVVCDEPGCWERVTCGTPTPDGYRSTCFQHSPW